MHYLHMPGIKILCGASLVSCNDQTRDPGDVTCPACIELLAEQVAEAIEDSALHPFTRSVKRSVRRSLLDSGLIAGMHFKDIELKKDKIIAALAVQLHQSAATITIELVPKKELTPEKK